MGDAEAQAIHREAPVIELHSDVPIDVVQRRMADERQVLLRRHLPRWRAGGVKASVVSFGGDQRSQLLHDPGSPFRSCMLALQDLREDVAESGGEIAIALGVADLRRLIGVGTFALLLNVEGVSAFEGKLAFLEIFHALGLRAFQLTWNGRNEAADGIAETHTGSRLTRFGRALLARANALGILVDASHLSASCFWDLAEHARAPFVCTHSNPAGRHAHPRNITDEQIRAVVASGGLVGVACYPGFLSEGQPTVEHVLDHLEYVLKVADEDHVGIGPDFIDYAEEIILAAVSQSGVAYGETRAYPPGISRIEEMPNLTAGLRKRGHPARVIRKVLGENFLRVLERVEAAAG